MSRRAGGVAASAPWIVVLLGVLVMIVLLVLALTAVRDTGRNVDRSTTPTLAVPTVPAVDPVSATPGSGPSSLTPSPSGSPSTTPTASPSRSGRSSPSATPRPSQEPRSSVTARYRVMESYTSSFIGETLLTNVTDQPQDWTVRLVFPSEVGRLRAFWSNSLIQPTVSRSGNDYIFTSGVSLKPGQNIWLRFHFRRDGTTDHPSTCTVNGAACTMG